MKVLFAVSSENISEAIVKKYQKEYKEILSYKNVYYFNAILKEIQKDKSYDRIIISEDLESFSKNNYDTIDKFIFEKLDEISDEAQDIDGNETSIILICTDRRTKGSSFLVKIFGIGIYNALLGTDRSMEQVCKLINKPRVKKEAKLYYKIDSEDVNYSNKSGEEVSELEIQNILIHFKKLGKNTDKFADSFNNIASQYTDDQLKIIVNCLPDNVKSVLEDDCKKYQEIISANGMIQKVNRDKLKNKENEQQTGIKIDIIQNKMNQNKMSGPIVIPSSVKTSKNRGPKGIEKNIEIPKNDEENNIQKKKIVKKLERDSKENESKISSEGVKKVKKIKKNPTDGKQELKKDSIETKETKKSNNPESKQKVVKKDGKIVKKVVKTKKSVEEDANGKVPTKKKVKKVPPVKENKLLLEDDDLDEDIILPGANNDFEDDDSVFPRITELNENDDLDEIPLPGLDDEETKIENDDLDDEFEIEDDDSDEELEIEDDDLDEELEIEDDDLDDELEIEDDDSDEELEIEDDDSDEEYEIEDDDSDEEYEIEDDDSDEELEIEDDDLDEELEIEDDDSDEELEIEDDDSDEELEIEDDDSDEEYEIEDDDSDEEYEIEDDDSNEELEIEDDDLDEELEIEDDDSDEELEIEDDDSDEEYEIEDNDLDDEFDEIGIDDDFEDDEYTDEVTLPNLDDLDDINEDKNDNIDSDDSIDNILPDADDEEDLLTDFEEDEDLVSSENDNNSNETQVESIKPKVDYSMSNLNSLLTKDKKIVTFIGAPKNGTSFLINNLAALFSSIGINTAILDMTKNKNSYYIYTNNEEELRNIAFNSIYKLQNGGIAEGIKVNNNLSVYTALPNDGKDYSNAEPILSTLVQNHSLILIDCDFDTDPSYFASCQEIYLIQSMDILTIQPLTAFLRNLKSQGVLEAEKVRVVINKELKVRSLTTKTIIAGMSFYNDPSMSFMTELFNKDMVKACSIPFDEIAYSKYLDSMVNCKISINEYSKQKQFMSKLRNLGDMVYPLVSKSTYGKNVTQNNFSNDMNNTLNQMKKKY